jgi:hypothetical protein
MVRTGCEYWAIFIITSWACMKASLVASLPIVS